MAHASFITPVFRARTGRRYHGAMNVLVAPAAREDHPRLRALFELYAYDFSAMLGFDVEDDGRFAVPPLEAYWAEPARHPFLIRVDDKLAGFALVHQRSRLTGDDGVYDMAELFVMRKYRRRGVGERAATWLFERFRGRWEVRERAENPAATAFWRRVIGGHTGQRFDEVLWDDERWRGPVQRFAS
jgi:predicted acetyltransferase